VAGLAARQFQPLPAAVIGKTTQSIAGVKRAADQSDPLCSAGYRLLFGAKRILALLARFAFQVAMVAAIGAVALLLAR